MYDSLSPLLTDYLNLCKTSPVLHDFLFRFVLIADSIIMSTQRTPSQFSACMIGVHDKGSQNNAVNSAYKAEAKEVANYLTGVHHARKLPAMQLNYAETVGKLSRLQNSKPLTVEPPATATATQHRSKDSAMQVLNQTEYLSKMKADLSREVNVNNRKKNYNFSMGQTSNVSQVSFEYT